MKPIEKVAFDRYISDQSLPVRKRMDASNYIDWAQLGAREAQRWIPIEEELPEDGELCFIKFTTISGGFSYGIGIYKSRTKIFHRTQGCNVLAWRPIERKL